MICKECNSEMRKDDVDFSFPGCENIYWECDFCLTGCIEKIRFNQSFIEVWHSENDGIVKDYEVRKKINVSRRYFR